MIHVEIAMLGYIEICLRQFSVEKAPEKGTATFLLQAARGLGGRGNPGERDPDLGLGSREQGAIPLATLSAGRVQSLYDLMDASYDVAAFRSHSASLGHVALIDRNPRGREVSAMALAEKRRYDERSTAERGFSIRIPVAAMERQKSCVNA